MGDAWGGLVIRGLVHQGTRHSVYRATQTATARNVILKVLRTTADDDTHRARLLHELRIASQLQSEAVIQAYGTTSYEGRLALVLEDFGGGPLTRTVSKGSPLRPKLIVARGVARALADVHRAGVVHRDVKPSNVIHRPETGELKLSDFGIARVRGEAYVTPRGAFEGTLAYMAPEQSGRTQTEVDHRADLYAFGVLLYELLAGDLPFHAESAPEWIHCHAAQLPRPLSEVAPDVPEVLGAVVLRLLAKAPEERYQSAEGVERDLGRCEASLAEGMAVGTFSVGQEDVSSELRLPSRVHGREGELRQLRETFERVALGRKSEVLRLEGYSGVGKTALAHELEHPVARRGGYFASGKFDQYRQHVPYLAVVQAGNALVEQLLAASREALSRWRAELLEALDGNGQVLVDLFPRLARVLGPQAPVAQLSPSGTQNRLHHAARVFVRAFEVPVVLVFDDLQWADAASLDLLEALLTHGERIPLLTVFAYRDHEVSLSHPLPGVVERVQASGTPVTTLTLAPLTEAGVRELVGDTLRIDDSSRDLLLALLLDKTAGNPFFVREFLRTLHQSGILRFEPSIHQWSFDARAAEARQMTDNVVHLMMERIDRLPVAAREALRVAAYVGNELDVEELAAVMGRDARTVALDLRVAADQGLVSFFTTRDGRVRARFGHDRIQQAADALTPDADKPALHLRVGRLLWSRLAADPSASRLFEVANHLDAAFDLVVDAGERERLLELFLEAARVATAATAYAQARTYLLRAAALLDEAAWQTRFELSFDVQIRLAECDYLAGHLDPARARFADLLRRGRTDLERGRVYYLQIHLFQVASDLAEAAALSLRSFSVFGLEAPTTPEEAARVVEQQHALVVELLAGKPALDRLDDPRMTDPRIRMLVDLLEASGPPIYMVRPDLFAWVALELVIHSLRYGNAAASCYGYGIYALLRAAVLGDVEGGYEFSQLAIKLNEQLGDVKLAGCMLHLLGDHVNFWKHPVATDLPILERGFLACVRGGDNIYSNYIGFQSPWHLYESGAPLSEVTKLAEKYASFARETSYEPVYQTIRAEQQFVLALMGGTAAKGELGSDDFNVDEALSVVSRAKFGCGIVYIHILRLVALYTFREWERALEAAAQALPELGSAFSMPIYVTFGLYHGLTLAALCDAAPEGHGAHGAQREKYLAEAKAHHAALESWARANPANFADKAALLGAEIARVTGDIRAALSLYEEARLAARRQGFVQYEALACERAAVLYDSLRVASVRRLLLADASALYLRWGASGKVDDLILHNPWLEQSSYSTSDLSPTTDTHSTTTLTAHLDLFPVLKASQSLSAEIELPRLLPNLASIVVEYTGAVRGSLLLLEGTTLKVAAEATVDLRGAEAVPHPRPVSALPSSVLRYVERTGETVLVDDASAPNKFAADPYFQVGIHRSILCKPIVRQEVLIGMFYLENPLHAAAFNPTRLVALDVLASQTAISVENSRLYAASQAAVAARDEFLSIASHELKTPLAPLAMQMYRLTNALRRGALRTMSEEALGKLTATCEGQIRRLDRLVSTLLDVSRIESGHLALDRASFDLSHLVRSTVEHYAAVLAAAGCTVALTLEPAVLGAWDPVRVEQAFTNLLMNALKFGRRRPLEIDVCREVDGARVTVADHGVGVSAEDRDRIFRRFERVPSPDNVDGLGLGLFIVRAIAEAHGGRVDVESTAGGGATFRLHLPDAAGRRDSFPVRVSEHPRRTLGG